MNDRIDIQRHPVHNRLVQTFVFQDHNVWERGSATTVTYLDVVTRATIFVTTYHDVIEVTACLPHGTRVARVASIARRDAVDGVSVDLVGYQISEALRELEQSVTRDAE